MAKITYDDKTNPNAVTNRATQASADDFNEIKTSVNSLYDQLVDSPDGLLQQLTVTGSGDDAGAAFIGQVSVGAPGAGRELVVGEGDSYPVELAFHCTIANTTGFTITGATDVTSELASDSGSTVGMFGGATAGNYLLVGSDYPFGGTKTKIGTLGVIEPDNIQGEYLPSTSGWSAVSYMVTDADFPYTQKGREISSCSSCSEQWRFGFVPGNVPTPWDKVTININGTDYTKYWGRFRIVTAITTDALLEQLKLHTNRWEANADGNTEYFGRARYPKTIPIRKSTNAEKNPANENISIAPGITILRTDNEFASGS